MKGWEEVDLALDQMFLTTPTMTEFNRRDIAGALGCSPREASNLLQRHRKAQGRGMTRYIVAARDYARATKWFVLAASGHTIGTAERRRLTMGHGEHIATDAARRVLRDIRSELDPALISHPAIQAYMTHAEASMEAQVRLLVGSIQSAVSLIESVNSEAADRRSVKAV